MKPLDEWTREELLAEVQRRIGVDGLAQKISHEVCHDWHMSACLGKTPTEEETTEIIAEVLKEAALSASKASAETPEQR